MPGRSTHKYVVSALGTVGSKRHVWIAGVFTDVKQAKPFVALLNVARKAGDEPTIKAMDVHAPTLEDGKQFDSVKYSGASIQYSPEAPGLSDEAELA